MNLLFVNYGGFDSQSAIHIFHFANELVQLGANCAVAVPGNPQKVETIGKPKFSPLDFRQLESGDYSFAQGRPPDIVHAWTPREIVRLRVAPIVLRHRCPYVVHLEDNEQQLTEDALGVKFDELASLPSQQLNQLIPPQLAHPIRARRFIEGASALTVIIDRLLEFKPENIPGLVIWPSYSENFASIPPENPAMRRHLGVPDDCFVVVYPGNVHASNCAEVRSLYLAIALLNRRGFKVRLVRLGRDYVPLFQGEQDPTRDFCIELGFRPQHESVAEVLSIADALVQPGSSNSFNDYRFPSKLTEFLISGRPVILPFSNVGRHLTSGSDCIHLYKGAAIEIAEAVSVLIKNEALRARIGVSGRQFAEREFSWAKHANALFELYGSVMSRRSSCSDEESDGLLES